MAARLTDQLAVERLVRFRGQWPLLRKNIAAIFDPAAIISLGIHPGEFNLP